MARKKRRTKKSIKQHKAEEFGKEINQTSLIDILSESLVANVIAGLPIASICAWRCVNKLFLKLISENWFTKLYAEISPYITVVINTNFGVHLVELAKGNCQLYKSIIPINKAKSIGSCNGLLLILVSCEHLLRHYGPDIYCLQPYLYLCNPILGQYARLPEPGNNNYTYNGKRKEVYGLGIITKTGNYKILRISTPIDPPHPIYKKRSEADVLIIGTNTWKRVGYLPYPSNQESLGGTVKGAFHWLFYNEMKDFTSLYAFNIEDEQNYMVPFPPNIGNDKVNMSVGMLNNCLCLFDNSHPAHFGIWSMEEYGVRESWALKCILTASIPAGICKSTIHPLAALKDDGFIIKSGSGNFYFYDQKNMNFTRFEIDNVELLAEFNYLTIHSSSFCPIDLMSTGCVLDTEVSARCSAHKSK
ncbi:F-box protein At3g07870 [Daucus carota subsp. sativus]|uniref:F-box protein At3g07870 n=1 Tax=Daucus carota subsp. sativus TaxID=79200 RepID=UPI0007F00E55|nr:PREDICTED: F-box protein At3g07870-like [Daucus carota subsp. sativus]